MTEVHSSAVSVARKLAMHVIAARPRYLEASQVPADVLRQETSIFREITEKEAEGKNKTPEVVEKIIKGTIIFYHSFFCAFICGKFMCFTIGKVSKRISEICLLGQNHVAVIDYHSSILVFLQMSLPECDNIDV
jgi:translation elongation factor EF-Ts